MNADDGVRYVLVGISGAPKPFASIPHANTPVRLPEVRKARASLIANVTVGAVLIVLTVGGIVFYFAAGLA